MKLYLKWLIYPLMLFTIIYCFNSTIDDSFVTYQYSKNLVEHGVLEYNLGDQVEGYTSITWVIINAVPHLLNFSPALFSKIVGLLCFFAILGAVYSSPGNKRKLLILMINVPLIFHSVTGMETMLTTMLLFLTWKYRYYYWFYPLSVLTVLTRPELIIIIFPWTVIYKKYWWPLIYFPLFVYFMCRWWYFGEIIPQTAQIKMFGMGFQYVGLFLAGYLFLFIFVDRVFHKFNCIFRVHKSDLILWMPIIIYLGFICFINPITGGLYRFLIPLVPVIICMLKYYPGFKLKYLVLILLIVFTRDMVEVKRIQKRIPSNLITAAKQLKGQGKMITTAAGAPKYFADWHVIDTMNLTNKQKITKEFLEEYNPDLILIHNGYHNKIVKEYIKNHNFKLIKKEIVNRYKTHLYYGNPNSKIYYDN